MKKKKLRIVIGFIQQKKLKISLFRELQFYKNIHNII